MCEGLYDILKWTSNIPSGKCSICVSTPARSTARLPTTNVRDAFKTLLITGALGEINLINYIGSIETKNQWARDDPAFVAILIFFMGMASLSYAIAFQAESFFGIIRTMMWSIIVDFLLVGALIATLNWYDLRCQTQSSP